MWNEIRKIKSDKKALREFGLVMAAFFAIIGLIAMFRGRAHYAHLLSAAGLFGLAAALLPRLLLPLQKAWMAFSIVIGFFMSRIIMMVLFYGVMTPMGLAMRIFGKDVLDQRIDKDKASYWHIAPKIVKARENYENQY